MKRILTLSILIAGVIGGNLNAMEEIPSLQTSALLQIAEKKYSIKQSPLPDQFRDSINKMFAEEVGSEKPNHQKLAQLIKMGADVNATYNNLTSLYRVAASNSSYKNETMRFLLLADADPRKESIIDEGRQDWPLYLISFYRNMKHWNNNARQLNSCKDLLDCELEFREAELAPPIQYCLTDDIPEWRTRQLTPEWQSQLLSLRNYITGMGVKKQEEHRWHTIYWVNLTQGAPD
jgi:hypothetical protein